MMSRNMSPIIAAAAIFAFSLQAHSQEETTANPYYKFWAKTKPGASAVHVERTKHGGAEGKLVPAGLDEKQITYKLVEVKDDRAIVAMVVMERDFLGYIQSAPTRYIYPAKIDKASLSRIYVDPGDKAGEDTVKVGDQMIKCKTIAGTVAGSNGEQIQFKIWLSDAVPGMIVKQVRTARQKDELIAETTSTLKSYKNAE